MERILRTQLDRSHSNLDVAGLILIGAAQKTNLVTSRPGFRNLLSCDGCDSQDAPRVVLDHWTPKRTSQNEDLVDCIPSFEIQPWIGLQNAGLASVFQRIIVCDTGLHLSQDPVGGLVEEPAKTTQFGSVQTEEYCFYNLTRGCALFVILSNVDKFA